MLRKKSVGSSLPLAPGHQRTRLLVVLFDFLFLAIIARLFYWQVINHSVLRAEAEQQYTRVVPISGHRGRIFTDDGYTLVDNQTVYRLFAQPNLLQGQTAPISQVLSGLMVEDEQISTDAATLKTITDEWRTNIQTKLADPQVKWVTLKGQISESTKQKIAEMNFNGIGFEPYEIRAYPEASMAAHVTGFVGKDKEGNDQGYFGIEGALNRELRGQDQQKTFLKDALGFHLLFDNSAAQEQQDGRDVTLTLRRDIQHLVEESLQKGIEQYGAVAGEVIVMEPKTGRILAMAAFPQYDPAKFARYDPSLYKNPTITDVFEPGSIFKIITESAGIDTQAIKADTQCDICDGPRRIGEYTIRTWNNEYHPNISMTDALVHSDNVAMIYIAQLVGQDHFSAYIQRFGIGEKIQIDLQEDTNTPMRKDWKPIDLATASFGQGIVTNSLQMVRAVGAIANQGKMMRPAVMRKVSDRLTGKEVEAQPIMERQVVSPETAQMITQMLVRTADDGEAKWIASPDHLVAAKTGTAQIPIAGHYDKDKTIASFVGFAPPNDPKFVMLVKLREPSKSPWAAETAAPLWYAIANKLFMLLNIPADR